MSLAAGARLGPYEIGALLGRGGMGEVYRALDTRVGRIVAVKVLPADAALHPERRQRFEREAQAVARLNHPHICTLYDVGQQDGVEFLVMEFLDGETLSARLSRGPLPLDEALKHATALAQALARAHHEGITHRDIKPSNVMLTDAGVKLLDFGLAKLRDRSDTYSPHSPIEDQSTDTAVSAEGTLVGTIAYTPPAVERIVLTALAKDPDKRWQDARDLARELAWVATGSHTTTVEAAPRRGRQRLRRWLLPAAVVIIATVATVTFVVKRNPASTIRSLVILPCQVIGDDARGRAYCNGLAETLTAKLTPLTIASALPITPVSEVQQRGVATASDARREFGATLAIGGSVSADGGTIRINYALIDTRTLRQIDAISITAVADPFSVQDQVVGWAVRVLAVAPFAPERPS